MNLFFLKLIFIITFANPLLLYRGNIETVFVLGWTVTLFSFLIAYLVYRKADKPKISRIELTIYGIHFSVLFLIECFFVFNLLPYKYYSPLTYYSYIIYIINMAFFFRVLFFGIHFQKTISRF